MWEEKHLYSDHRVNKTTKKTVKADHCANGPLNQIFMSNGKHQGFPLPGRPGTQYIQERMME